MNKDNEYEIPERATVRHEHVRCSNPDCQHLHGPYLYAYWKDGKRLLKRYIGKTIDDLLVRKVATKADTTPTKMRKLKVIKEKAQGGNLLAQEYLEKLKNGKVGTDSAKVLTSSMREQRMLKMIAVVEQRHLSHNNPDELAACTR